MTDAEIYAMADQHGSRYRTADEEGMTFDKHAVLDFARAILVRSAVAPIASDRTADVPACESTSWVRLADSHWVNIVNAPSVLDPFKDKEEAVREAVKLTEAKLKLLNVGPWCCEKGRAAGVEVCRECAETNAGYLAAMSPRAAYGVSRIDAETISHQPPMPPKD